MFLDVFLNLCSFPLHHGTLSFYKHFFPRTVCQTPLFSLYTLSQVKCGQFISNCRIFQITEKQYEKFLTFNPLSPYYSCIKAMGFVLV